jgi:hypothetical protein
MNSSFAPKAMRSQHKVALNSERAPSGCDNSCIVPPFTSRQAREEPIGVAVRKI